MFTKVKKSTLEFGRELNDVTDTRNLVLELHKVKLLIYNVFYINL